MSKRVLTFLCIIALFSFFLSGCYYFSATKEMKAAEKLISELKAAGGATLVPYEYCSAEGFLEASKIEYSQNDFGPAKGLAERSKSAAQAGLDKIKKK